MDFDEISYTLIEKAKLKSLKNKNRRLICCYNASLYVSDRYCNWRNLKMNGFITFELDYSIKTRYISLFDMDTLELLFEYELYINFENNLMLCESNFLSFEIDGGFIGIQFIYDNEAISFKILITKYSQSFIVKMIEKKSFDYSPEYENTSLLKTRKNILLGAYMEILKKNYKEISQDNENQQIVIMNMNNNVNEDGKTDLEEYHDFKSNLENLLGVFREIFIKKIKNLNFILKVTFDPKIKKFNIDNIPQEMKKALNKNGIKKHQFTDTEFALNIFKNFIEKYDKNTGYLNFFGRIVKVKKHRKALDWVGIVRRKKKNDNILNKSDIFNGDVSDSHVIKEENHDKINTEEGKTNTTFDIQSNLNIGKQRMSILKDRNFNNINQAANKGKSIKFIEDVDCIDVKSSNFFDSSNNLIKETMDNDKKDKENSKNENPNILINKTKLIDLENKCNDVNKKGNNKGTTRNELMQISIKQRREFLTKYDVSEDDSCDSDWSN